MSDLQPWRGKAGQLRVGHKVFGSYRTPNDVWEILAFANPEQIGYGMTLWTRVRNTTTGAEFSVPPRLVTQGVTFALTEEELEAATQSKRPPERDVVPAVDAAAIALLVERLGAQEIATRDNETGEITCPTIPSHLGAVGILPELEHLRICHGLDIAGLEAIADPQKRIHETLDIHAREHGSLASQVGRGGFPHRHIPERPLL